MSSLKGSGFRKECLEKRGTSKTPPDKRSRQRRNEGGASHMIATTISESACNKVRRPLTTSWVMQRPREEAGKGGEKRKQTK